MPSFYSCSEDLISILNKCSKDKNIIQLLRLKNHMRACGLEVHPSVGHYLISVLMELGRVFYAHKVFERMSCRNESLWNSLIVGYFKQREFLRILIIYKKIKEDCLHLDGYTFVILLKTCALLKDMEVGHELHSHVSTLGLLESNAFVCSTLVDMYAKCGCITRAQEVFDQLSVQTVVIWNTLITGYIKCGEGKKALHCFQHMQYGGIPPDDVTFICMLKACSNLGLMDKGMEIYVEVAKKGFDKEVVVGSMLVDMYAKCDSIDDARCVFERAVKKDIVTWNVIMTGCVYQGMHDECLKYFYRIQHENMMPNDVSFISGLKACIGCTSLIIGKQIHIQVFGSFLGHANINVLNTVLDVYAKCGDVENASLLFWSLPRKDLTTWNVMVFAFAKEGLLLDAYSLVGLMKENGFEPDEVTLSTLLKACTSLPNLEHGRFGHLLLVESGMILNAFTCSILLEMYVKCGSYDDAWKVFEGMGDNKNNIGWNVMIAGCIQHGHMDNAFSLFNQMLLEGNFPDKVTALSILKTCPCLATSSCGRFFHVYLMEMGLLSDVSVSNTLTEMYVKRGSIEDVYRVFSSMQVHDVTSWNILIMALVQKGLGEDALILVGEMLQKQVEANHVTFTSILKVCSTMAILEWGMEVHSLVVVSFNHSESLSPISSVGSALVDMYAKCGSINDARNIFDGMQERQVVTWTAMISGYSLQGLCKEALDLWEKMVDDGVKPDGVTFGAILSAYTRVGMVQEGGHIFIAMQVFHGMTPTSEHLACMVDLLARCGLIHEANCLVVESYTLCDDVVCMALLDACRRQGSVKLARLTFDRAIQLDDDNCGEVCLVANVFGALGMQEDAQKVQVMRLNYLGQKEVKQILMV